MVGLAFIGLSFIAARPEDVWGLGALLTFSGFSLAGVVAVVPKPHFGQCLPFGAFLAMSVGAAIEIYDLPPYWTLGIAFTRAASLSPQLTIPRYLYLGPERGSAMAFLKPGQGDVVRIRTYPIDL